MVLGLLNARMQRFGRVVFQYRHPPLGKDFSGIHAGIDIMNSASGFGLARLQRLLPGGQAPGTWEAGMDEY